MATLPGHRLLIIGEMCDYIFIIQILPQSVQSAILIQFDRTDTLIWRYQPFKNNIACFSFIESSTSFTSKVSTLTVNAELIANRKLRHDSTCTCCRYAQGKKKSTDFVLISPSTLPLTNCWFSFFKGLWDLYTIYHDNDISYRAIAKHKEGGLEYLP